jgi:hypothetical protein
LRAAQNERRNVLVLPGGHELKPIGLNPSEGQMEEARKMQVTEFSRWFGLPPVFLQDLERATFTNSEQQDLHLVKHTLRQWLECWEQELNAKLFPASNRKNFVEFNQDALLRGDFKSRMEGYAAGIQNGFLAPDEVRAMENRPAMGGDAASCMCRGRPCRSARSRCFNRNRTPRRAAMLHRETRALGVVEARAEGETRKITGYAAVFNSPTDIGGISASRSRRARSRPPSAATMSAPSSTTTKISSSGAPRRAR